MKANDIEGRISISSISLRGHAISAGFPGEAFDCAEAGVRGKQGPHSL